MILIGMSVPTIEVPNVSIQWTKIKPSMSLCLNGLTPNIRYQIQFIYIRKLFDSNLVLSFPFVCSYLFKISPVFLITSVISYLFQFICSVFLFHLHNKAGLYSWGKLQVSGFKDTVIKSYQNPYSFTKTVIYIYVCIYVNHVSESYKIPENRW